jgi:hypothetical protein
MGNLSALVMVLELTFIGGSAQRSDTQAKVEPREQRTLEYALSVAGREVANLPIELASVRHAGASPYADAWTTYSGEGKGLRIFVLRSTYLFRCASASTFACVRMLASTLVHEAWHFNHGPDEAAAYEAQLTFLRLHGASETDLDRMRTNRDYVLRNLRRTERTPKSAESLASPPGDDGPGYAPRLTPRSDGTLSDGR